MKVSKIGFPKSTKGMELITEYFNLMGVYISASNAGHDDAADDALKRIDEIEKELEHTGIVPLLQRKSVEIMRRAPTDS